jgi:uncharacterized repeat protein (TIGR03806 family)
MVRNVLTVLFLLGLIFTLFSECKPSESGQKKSKNDILKLSEYGFFKGELSDLVPVDEVLPYDLNTPLFTDYAHKSRFVKFPADSSATYQIDGVLDFPLGTILIKNFFYYHDERNLDLGKKIIETRLLIKKEDEWESLNYIWNEQQKEAFLDVAGDIVPITWIDTKGDQQNIQYVIPNKNQCRSCHNVDGKLSPIGPKVAHLNRDFEYLTGTANQLTHWSEKGILNGFDPKITHPKSAEWGNMKFTLHERAMAYLDINCGHCHNPKGAANTSGLHLVLDNPMDINLGIYKATVSAGGGTGGHTYSIVPGSSSTSIMINRMRSTNPGAMMPEVGRTMVHEEGVQLIAEWIAKMDKNQFKHLSVAELK